jgi:hypothetical protein
MSLTVFLAICVLGLDFMIFVLFNWLYGERHAALPRAGAMLTRRHLFTVFPERVNRREVQGVPTGQQRRAGYVSSPNRALAFRAGNRMVTATTRASPDPWPDDASDGAFFTGSRTRLRDALGSS